MDTNRIRDYVIVDTTSVIDLQRLVNGMMEEEWQPYGTIVFNGEFVHQVMVRYYER